jgi:hypothetical protein
VCPNADQDLGPSPFTQLPRRGLLGNCWAASETYSLNLGGLEEGIERVGVLRTLTLSMRYSLNKGDQSIK